MITVSNIGIPMRRAEWLRRDAAWRAGWVEGARFAVAKLAMYDVQVAFIDSPSFFALADLDTTTPAVREGGTPA